MTWLKKLETRTLSSPLHGPNLCICSFLPLDPKTHRNLDSKSLFCLMGASAETDVLL